MLIIKSLIGILIAALGMSFLLRRLIQVFKTERSQSKPSNRLKLSDVVANDYITINYPSRIKQGIAKVMVVSNDPVKKRICLYFNWKDEPHEYDIFDYNDKIFKDFHLLNSEYISQNPKDDQSNNQETSGDSINTETDIAKLQKDMDKALSVEDYRKADKIQKRIDKLTGKKA